MGSSLDRKLQANANLRKQLNVAYNVDPITATYLQSTNSVPHYESSSRVGSANCLPYTFDLFFLTQFSVLLQVYHRQINFFPW